MDARTGLGLIGWSFDEAARAMPDDRAIGEIAYEDLYAASRRFNRVLLSTLDFEDVVEYAIVALVVALCMKTGETPRSFFERKFSDAPSDAWWRSANG